MKICLPGEKVKSNSAIFTVGRIFFCAWEILGFASKSGIRNSAQNL